MSIFRGIQILLATKRLIRRKSKWKLCIFTDAKFFHMTVEREVLTDFLVTRLSHGDSYDSRESTLETIGDFSYLRQFQATG